MQRLSLRTQLVAFNVATVIVAIGVVGIAGVTLVRYAADEQAVARVRQASANAARVVARDGESLKTSALLLAGRPTLERLVREGDPGTLGAFLETFCKTSELDGCGVFRDGHALTCCGWPSVLPGVIPGEAEAGWWLVAPVGSPRLYLGGSAPVTAIPGARVAVLLEIDQAYVQAIGEKVGLAVEIVPGAIAERRVARPGGELGMRAIEGGRATAARVKPLGAYLAAAPLADPSGRVTGVVEVRQPVELAAPSLTQLVGTLVGLACMAGLLATIFGLLLSRSVTAPIEELTAAALRIGGGDLASPVARASGTEIGTLAGAMDDMRARMLALTSAAHRRQAEAEAILTGIVEGVYAVGRARKIRYLNPQAAALLGVRPEEAIGQFCGDVLNPQGPGGVRPCEEQCPIVHARFRGSARATEVLLLPNGRRRTVVITSSPSGPAAENGAALQFQVIRDETELETSRRLRDTVLANVSHEFRTPLSAQLASLELLLDRLDDLAPADLRKLILSVQRGTLRLTRLVDNLLESTRIEAGEESLRRQSVALDEVVEEAIELIAPLVEQRKQKLQVHLPYPLPAVVGDGPRLVQVFVNLLANANKFAPVESTITVGGSVSETEIEIWVADEGPGLPPGLGEEIFQRFLRSGEEEPEASGMGLGLFIVKSIVDRHGGRVEALSHNRGTRMRVILPREPGPAGARAESPAGGAAAGEAEAGAAGDAARGADAAGESGGAARGSGAAGESDEDPDRR